MWSPTEGGLGEAARGNVHYSWTEILKNFSVVFPKPSFCFSKFELPGSNYGLEALLGKIPKVEMHGFS